ncbi:MAG: NHL repeat-containing protein [Solirubrobacterales bacterium]
MRRAVLAALLTIAIVLVLAPSALAFEWLGQYGVGYSGGGNGDLNAIYGIGVAPDGTVVVSDQGASRVSLFSQSGHFLRAFGKDVSQAPGEGPEVCTTDCKFGLSSNTGGALSQPWGIAAGTSEIFVAERGNQRVSVFDYQGHFLRAFGADVGGPGVNLCTASCTFGTSGVAAGQMDAPAGLALDASGELLVSETSSNRVDVFNPQSGQFIRAFGKDVGGPGIDSCTTVCQTGTFSTAPGALESPYGLSIGPNGDIFVSESSNSRISVFNSTGQFQRSFGSFGNGAGNLESPYGVAVSADGNVYVADTNNYRLSEFGVAGDFRRALGWNVNGFNTGAGTCTAPCQAGSPEYGIGAFNNLYAVATDCRGTVYVANYDRVDKYGEPGTRTPPCPSNAFSFGKSTADKKKGTLSVEVDVSGPGSLTATAGPQIAATVPQPSAAGAVHIALNASGKGIKTLAKTGKLKGSLSVTFTPPNGDPNTQSEAVQLTQTVKKHKKRGKHKGGKHHH